MGAEGWGELAGGLRRRRNSRNLSLSETDQCVVCSSRIQCAWRVPAVSSDTTPSLSPTQTFKGVEEKVGLARLVTRVTWSY